METRYYLIGFDCEGDLLKSKKNIIVGLLVTVILIISAIAVWNDIYSSKVHNQVAEIKKEEAGAVLVPKTTEMPVINTSPSFEIIPSGTLVGKKFPFCGRDDIASAYSKIDGDENYIIPACQQIIATISESNLIVFEVLEVNGQWLKIVARAEDQLKFEDLYGAVKEYDISIGRMGQESWIRKDLVTTAWSIEDGKESYFIPAFAPSMDKNEDGTWNVLSTSFPCNYSPSAAYNPPELRQNISYDIDRDCGT